MTLNYPSVQESQIPRLQYPERKQYEFVVLSIDESEIKLAFRNASKASYLILWYMLYSIRCPYWKPNCHPVEEALDCFRLLVKDGGLLKSTLVFENYGSSLLLGSTLTWYQKRFHNSAIKSYSLKRFSAIRLGNYSKCIQMKGCSKYLPLVWMEDQRIDEIILVKAYLFSLSTQAH